MIRVQLPQSIDLWLKVHQRARVTFAFEGSSGHEIVVDATQDGINSLQRNLKILSITTLS